MVWQPSDNLKTQKWPTESLTLTADEGDGFHPLRLGEAFDDTRFIVTRKFGWGGFSTVWLVRDKSVHIPLCIILRIAGQSDLSS